MKSKVDSSPFKNNLKSPINLEAESRQLEFLYKQNQLAALSAFVSGLLLCWILWDVISHERIITWLTILFIASIGRVMLVMQFNKQRVPQEQNSAWRKRIIIVAALFGAIWGSASLFLFAENSIPHIAFMGLVIVGIAGGAVPYLSAVWPVYLLTAMPATLFFALRLFVLGGEIPTSMGLLVLIFTAMMIFTSWRMRETVIESINLRFDKETMARDLSLAKAVKEQATLVAKESDERVNVLAEAPFEGIFVHEDGQVLDANRTLLEMLGIKLEDALGRKVIDFVDVESRDSVERELQNPTGQAFKTNITRPDGKSMMIEVRGRHFPRKGRTIRVVSIRIAE